MTAASGTEDRGAGTTGTSVGVVVFLLLMLAAVQILFDLYASTMVTAAAYDAAREVASVDVADDRCRSVDGAEQRFVEALGNYGRRGHASLTWTCTADDVVRVRVVADHPTVLPRRLAGLLSLGHLDRTIEVRAETAR